ncbi:Dabb family protein [Cellulophaga sp. HaHaR_3_176]|nr:Dabb family protein [Cellulophaga sp. HaHaR_3_176]QWX84000.1 Dabb family protein [Cellulophaga sp. HaHaR_3_176]
MKIKSIVTVVIILLFSVLSSYGQTKTTMKDFDSNYAHTVYFWLNNPDSKEGCKAFEVSLRKFLDNSAYAKTKFIGVPPRASREVVDGSFTYSLIVTFESADAQQEYQKEAPHLLFIEESSKLWNKVIVYDSKAIIE